MEQAQQRVGGSVQLSFDSDELTKMRAVLKSLEESGISTDALAPLKSEATRLEIEAALEAARLEADAAREAAQQATEEQQAADRNAARTDAMQQLAMSLRRATSTRSSADLAALEVSIERAAAAGVDDGKVAVARAVLAKRGLKGGRQTDWDSSSAGDERWYEGRVKFR